MIFGGIEHERLQLNENTLTSDEPGYRTLPLNLQTNFSQVTNLLARRQFAEADDLITRTWLGRSWACYQPLGDLHLDFTHAGPATEYQRELDLSQARCRISYKAGGATFTREILASHPDRVLAIRLRTTQPGTLSFRARLTSPHSNAVVTTRADGPRLTLTGQVPGLVLRRTLAWVEQKGDTWKYPELWDEHGRRRPHAAQVLYGKDIGGRGTWFDARLGIRIQGGRVAADAGALVVEGAEEAVLVLSAASSYAGFDKSPSRVGPAVPARKAESFLKAAERRAFDQLAERHLRDYRALFDRVSLSLGPPTDQSRLPTDERIKRFANGQDQPLAALYFQFGRYLMISGSRPGGQPLNLQGMWNEEIIPPWASSYTININTEMNYWLAETAHLQECAEPLLRLIRELAVDGHRVARDMYGRRGWVAHHNTTLWRDAQPVDNIAGASFWPLGSGWLCQHLFEHYQFTRDLSFLREAYPLLRGACEFYLDWLVPDEQGRLVTPVGTSPENAFIYLNAAGRKTKANVCVGPAMDLAIIRDLFRNTITAAETLKRDTRFQAELRAALARLKPYQVGSKGQLLEWQEEFEEADPHHRHVSHLFGLHPGREIAGRTAPELAAAAKRSLELRGDGGTGWSKAWKVNFWARLEDGDHAHRMLTDLISKSTLPNLFDTHPPFQIDGNFGGAAGIVEMLLQSHSDELVLLPALPKAWPAGRVKGLRARGGFTVDIAWQDGRVTDYRITAPKPQPVRVRVNGQLLNLMSATP
jgi:alpha-L-fucosidase 2